MFAAEGHINGVDASDGIGLLALGGVVGAIVEVLHEVAVVEVHVRSTATAGKGSAVGGAHCHRLRGKEAVVEYCLGEIGRLVFAPAAEAGALGGVGAQQLTREGAAVEGGGGEAARSRRATTIVSGDEATVGAVAFSGGVDGHGAFAVGEDVVAIAVAGKACTELVSAVVDGAVHLKVLDGGVSDDAERGGEVVVGSGEVHGDGVVVAVKCAAERIFSRAHHFGDGDVVHQGEGGAGEVVAVVDVLCKLAPCHLVFTRIVSHDLVGGDGDHFFHFEVVHVGG